MATTGAGESLVSNQFNIRVGDVGESLGGGAGVGAGHVGDAVVKYTFFHIDGIVVGCRTGGFGAAALIDGDIHEDAAGTHASEHGAGDELGGFGSRHKDGGDEEIDVGEKFVEMGLAGEKSVGGVHGDIEKAHAFQIHLQDGDIRTQSCGHAGGVDSGGASSDDHDAAWENPRDASEKNAAASPVFR